MFRKVGKKLMPIAVASSIVLTSFSGVNGIVQAKGTYSSDQYDYSYPNSVENVIFLIGDGMGPTYNTAYRFFKDDKSTPYMEETAFDAHLVGMQQTYPWDIKVDKDDKVEDITDSGAAATAMSSGIKTYNNAIAVDVEQNEVETVLEKAKADGKATGLVATSQVTHATPASFGAHDVSRHNYNAIADDYYDEKINGEHKIDVILGGGISYFEREDRNLAEEFQADGYSYVKTKEELLKDDNEKILGLFAPVGLNYTIDRTDDEPSLAEMTKAALDRLSKNENGFYLMVEGSQIDWAGHDNDIVGAMSEMADFEEAYKVAIEFAKEDGNTLVVTTADHSTGGLAMGINGEYKWDPEPIKATKRTPDFMAEKIANGANVEETLKTYIDIKLTRNEIKSVKDAAKSKDVTEIDNAIERIFDKRSGTGWTTGGHDGVDVNVYAYGPQSELFRGLHDNHQVGQMVIDILAK